LDIQRHPDIHRAGRQTLLVVTGLVAQLAVHERHARHRGCRRLEARSNFKTPGVDRDRVGRKRELFLLRFRIDDLLGFQRIFIPGELDGNQIIVAGHVAIDVEARLQLSFQRKVSGAAALDGEARGRRDAENRVTGSLGFQAVPGRRQNQQERRREARRAVER